MAQIAIYKAFAEQAAALTHPSAGGDEITALRHRSFIASHLAVGILPFAALPAVLALGGGSGAVFAVFAWLVAPILIALDLSRSGDIGRARLISAVSFGALVALTAAYGGGLVSLATPWLALPVVEAAFAGSRRGAINAGVVAAVVAVSLAGFGAIGHLPQEPLGAVAAVGCVVAAVYALSLAVQAGALFRLAERPTGAREEVAALIAGAADDLVTRHGPNGATTFASAGAASLLGALPRDLLHQGLFARVHIGDRPAFLRAIAGAADAGAPTTIELRLRRGANASGKAGVESFVWVEMRARRLAATSAEPVFCVFRDVSERKAHERALIAAREEADRANLAKTRFLATMSHELRTPLNAIIGFSEILSDEELCRLAPERRADYAALIHKSGAHLLEVVNTLLDMAKIESGSFALIPTSCRVGDIVDHCARLMTLRAQTGGLTLATDVSPELPDIFADERALTQILLNLISNAIKFTPLGGEVTVEAKPHGDGVRLTVRDTGVGIAAADVGRLGEAFFQTPMAAGRREGTGIGFSVVRGLVALHHGDVDVESALGCGTRVVVRLPLDCRTQEPPAPAAAPLRIERADREFEVRQSA